MNKIKVYDADGKQVEVFTKAKTFSMKRAVPWLNSKGLWVKGQITNKGVKIK